MALPTTSFPPIRACIFDLDGLLINSEDMIGRATSRLLRKYDRFPLTSSMRARLMGVSGSTNSDMFHEWAQLPPYVSREAWAIELGEEMRQDFPLCKPLSGAEQILSNLRIARNDFGEKIQLALATTTKSSSFELKTCNPQTKKLLDSFPPEKRILGDDPRLKKGRSKPAPDIYLLALEAVNDMSLTGSAPILTKECLVFEDSIAGVEAARRAGMRVVWVPHPELHFEYQGIEKDVLAGRAGMFNVGDDQQVGQIDDGWAERISSLEKFDYGKYGIHPM